MNNWRKILSWQVRIEIPFIIHQYDRAARARFAGKKVFVINGHVRGGFLLGMLLRRHSAVFPDGGRWASTGYDVFSAEDGYKYAVENEIGLMLTVSELEGLNATLNLSLYFTYTSEGYSPNE